MVFAVQHENRWIATVSESERVQRARFSSRSPGPTGRRVGDGDEKESNASSRAKSVDLFIHFEVEVICMGLPKVRYNR